MEIRAGRYTIRSWQAGDEQAIVRNLTNENVTRNLARVPRNYTMEHAKAWIDLCALEADPVNFAIADGAEAIGSIGLTLQRRPRGRSAEIGFWIAEDRWGEGVATASVKALADFAFARFDLLRLYAYVFAGNDASVRVLEKAGFVYEGRLAKSIAKDDLAIDELVYALVR